MHHRIQGVEVSCQFTLPKFYERRAFDAAWNAEGLDQLVGMIDKASEEGLEPIDYHIEELRVLKGRLTALDDLQKADLDILATDAFLLYVSHLMSGKSNPETLDPEWHVIRREGDPLAILESAISTGEVTGSIRAVLPRHRVYQSLKSALVRYKKISEAGGWPQVPGGEVLKPGMSGDRIVKVRARLTASGDLTDESAENPGYFDQTLQQAVEVFQKRHGLEADGILGKLTLEAMNVTVESRISQIEVNMERWRWLPQEFSKYYIKVNIADFTMEIVNQDVVQLRRDIIVGKKYRRTPVFSSKMSYLVFNPTWTIPPGILRNDILPAVRKDPGYLKNRNIKVYGPQSKVLDPDSIDWQSTRAMSYTYIQEPGPTNALGAVKFMFPNTYSVYLHDTPSKELFRKSERTFSSGCIRVSQPLEVAAWLLADPVRWNLDAIKKIIREGKTITLILKEQPDVYILYWTAWTDQEGTVHFRKDIYERDPPIANSLRLKYSETN